MFRPVAVVQGTDLTDAQLNRIIKEAELDNDGHISLDEYIKMVVRLRLKKREEEEAKNQGKDPHAREKKLKKREQELKDHWDLLGADVKVFGEDEEGGMGPGKKKEEGPKPQRATWQNSLSDFAAFPVVGVKGCCCPCVQFGLNAREVLLQEEYCTTGSCGDWWAKHDLCMPLGMGWLLLCPLVATIAGGCSRFRLRRQLGIRGSAWSDCIVHCFCPCMAIIQEGAELDIERARRAHADATTARLQRMAMRGTQQAE